MKALGAIAGALVLIAVATIVLLFLAIVVGFMWDVTVTVWTEGL